MELIEDLIEEYMYHCKARGYTPKTIKNKNQEFKQFKKYLKEKRGIEAMDQLTVHDMKAYVRSKQQAKLQPQSIVAMAKMIKAFLNWCVKEEYIKENPMVKVDLPKVPKKVLQGFTVDEVQRMINAFTTKTYLEARNKAIIAMLADCGLRSIELRTLKEVNVKDTTILVNGKGNKERMVSVSPVLKKILIKYERLKRSYFEDKIVSSDNYFLSYQGGEMSHVGLYNLVVEAGRRAGIEGKRVSPHTFRHFYSVQVLAGVNGADGLDIYSLSRLLGHSNVSVTENYLQSLNDQELLRKAVTASPLMNYKTLSKN